MLTGIRRTAAALGVDPDRVRLDVVDVNGDPALAIRIDSQVDSIYTCSFEGDAISAFRIVRNPDKLRYIARQLADA
jgi:hypothetical protein